VPPSTAAQTAVISVIANEQTHELVKPVVHEAYRRIDYTVVFDPLPARRALEWANDGVTDGDLARIEGTERKFPNLIRISTPVIHFSGVAFATAPSRAITEWKDLAGLSIGIVRGILYSEIGTEGMDPIPANDMTHLFKLLKLGRIDVAVAVLDAGRIEIHRNYRGTGIQPVGDPLYVAPLFHYVHVKNGHLVQKLEAALKEMEASGEIEALREQALKEALEK
jgi:ABC-type amino acid transport substrate-binding protein